MDFLNKIKSGLKSIFSIDAGSYVNPQQDASSTGYGGSVLKVGNAVKNFGKEVLQGTARSAARAELSVLNTLSKKANQKLGTNLNTNRQFNPNQYEATKKIFGTEDGVLKDLKRTTEETRAGLKQGTIAYTLAPVAIYGGTALDLVPGFGNASKKTLTKIATESKSVDKILSHLATLGVSKNVAEEVAPKLLTVTQPRDVAFIVKNAEIVSRIENNTGKVLPSTMRKQIGEDIAQQQFASEKDAEIYFNKVINDIALQAPKNQKLSLAYEPLQTLAQKSPSQKQFIEEVTTMFAKFDEAEQLGKEIKDIPGYQAYQAFKQEVEQSGRTLNDIYNIAKRELKDTPVQKKIDSVVAPKTPDAKVEVARPMTKLKRDLKAQEKAGEAGFRRGVTEGKKTATTKERQAAKDKVLAVYEKVKAKAESFKALREEVRVFAKELPAAQRNKILSKKRFSEIKSEKQFFELLYDIEKETKRKMSKDATRVSYLEYQRLAKIVREKGLKAEARRKMLDKFGVIDKKTGKKILNNNIIKRMRADKLDELNKLLRNEFDKKAIPNTATREELSKVKIGSSKPKEGIGKGLADFGRNSLTSISTTIGKLGGDKLKYGAIRRFIFNKSQRAAQHKEVGAKFVKSLKKLGDSRFKGRRTDYNEFSYAVWNENFDLAREIATKRGFIKEFDKVVDMLKKTLAEQREVGIKVGQIENYFPRVVQDYDGLYAFYKKKFGKEGMSYFDDLLNRYAKEHFMKVTDMTSEERATVLNSALRGYGQKINTGASQATKARKGTELSSEVMQFYHKPEESLSIYLQRANERIEMQRLLGVGKVEESLGRFVDGLQLTPSQAAELRVNLQALLSPQEKEGILSTAIRNVSTMTLLTNISSTLTQLADISLNAKDHGVLKAVMSLFRNKPIKKKELFDSLIEELNGQFTTKFLKATGFELMDRVNLEARMGNDFRRAAGLIKKGKGKNYDNLINRLKASFPDEKELSQVIDDFKNKRVTDLTKFHVFNSVLDVSPRAISEMPLTYVKNPNLRAFYSMKSYSLKVLDIYRREVIQEMGKGNKGKAVKNFVVLTTYLTLAGATTDEIKDWYNGKETTFSDNVINNLLKIFMLSNYDLTSIEKDGLGTTIMNKVAPPTRLISDIGKDVIRAMDSSKTHNFEDFNSVRNIPIVGGELYNRLGKGKKNIQKKNDEVLSSSNLAEAASKKRLTQKQADYLNTLSKENPQKYADFKKEMKYKEIGMTPKEEGFADLGVQNGERAREVYKYIKSSKDPNQTYAKLKYAGIITPEVNKQLAAMNK